MSNLYQSLMVLFGIASKKRQAKLLLFYKRECIMLRAKLPKRITITRQERELLLKYGMPLGKDIRDVITIVHPDTFLRWVREDRKHGSEAQPVLRGRKRTKLAIRRLICKLARENDWGYGRIQGELKKLGIKSVSLSTIRNVLKRRGLDPVLIVRAAPGMTLSSGMRRPCGNVISSVRRRSPGVAFVGSMS